MERCRKAKICQYYHKPPELDFGDLPGLPTGGDLCGRKGGDLEERAQCGLIRMGRNLLLQHHLLDSRSPRCSLNRRPRRISLDLTVAPAVYKICLKQVPKMTPQITATLRLGKSISSQWIPLAQFKLPNRPLQIRGAIPFLEMRRPSPVS